MTDGRRPRWKRKEKEKDNCQILTAQTLRRRSRYVRIYVFYQSILIIPSKKRELERKANRQDKQSKSGSSSQQSGSSSQCGESSSRHGSSSSQHEGMLFTLPACRTEKFALQVVIRRRRKARRRRSEAMMMPKSLALAPARNPMKSLLYIAMTLVPDQCLGRAMVKSDTRVARRSPRLSLAFLAWTAA